MIGIPRGGKDCHSRSPVARHFQRLEWINALAFPCASEREYVDRHGKMGQGQGACSPHDTIGGLLPVEEVWMNR